MSLRTDGEGGTFHVPCLNEHAATQFQGVLAARDVVSSTHGANVVVPFSASPEFVLEIVVLAMQSGFAHAERTSRTMLDVLASLPNSVDPALWVGLSTPSEAGDDGEVASAPTA